MGDFPWALRTLIFTQHVLIVLFHITIMSSSSSYLSPVIKICSPIKSRVVFGEISGVGLQAKLAFLRCGSTLVLLQGNSLLDIQTETSTQGDWGSPEKGVRHREVASRWILAVEMKQTPLTRINWMSQ